MKIRIFLSRFTIYPPFPLSNSPSSWKSAVGLQYPTSSTSSEGNNFAISIGIYDFPLEDGALKLTLSCEFSVYAEIKHRKVRSLLLSSFLIVNPRMFLSSVEDNGGKGLCSRDFSVKGSCEAWYHLSLFLHHVGPQ